MSLAQGPPEGWGEVRFSRYTKPEELKLIFSVLRENNEIFVRDGTIMILDVLTDAGHPTDVLAIYLKPKALGERT